jgi:hypothetical protein
MKTPPQRSTKDLKKEADKAREIFRAARSVEPLTMYKEFFASFVPIFKDVFARLPELTKDEVDPKAVAEVFASKNRGDAFRYLAAPPISADDLEVLAEVTLSQKTLKADAAAAKRVRDTVLHLIDPYRFPWVKDKRAPRVEEMETAIVASTAILAAKRVEMKRRSDATKDQERQVKEALISVGFEQINPKNIAMLTDAPTPGQFCGESKFGPTRADVVISLYDKRIMALECKVSNSAVNSFKRLIHEAAGKAVKWLAAFGKNQTVPAAVLAGVYSVENLVLAQDQGLALFWSHDLSDLQEWIDGTKGS